LIAAVFSRNLNPFGFTGNCWCRTIPFHDAPLNHPDDASTTWLEVTDPREPLYGKRFQVLSVSRGPAASAHAWVLYRDQITLRLPLRSTSLSPLVDSRPQATLTRGSVEHFLSLVKEYELCQQPPGKSGQRSRRSAKNKSHKSSAKS
jgi:hypothetical protein